MDLSLKTNMIARNKPVDGTTLCFLIALAIFYFFASFNEVLPWSVCIPDVQLGMGVEHKICLETPETNITLSNITTTYDNITQDNRTNGDTHYITPTEQYLLYEVLNQTLLQGA